jgi:hypothetical protein
VRDLIISRPKLEGRLFTFYTCNQAALAVLID